VHFLLANHKFVSIDSRMSEETNEDIATDETAQQEKPIGEDPVNNEEIERELEEAAAEEELPMLGTGG